MTLTDTAIHKAKPNLKPRKLFDERGLFLLISPKGGNGGDSSTDSTEKKNYCLSVSILTWGPKEARDYREEARKQVAASIDPGEHRKAKKAAKTERATNSFEVVAREWFS